VYAALTAGLKQQGVEIAVTPSTAFDAAKTLACAAAGDLDESIHRLLFRGKGLHSFTLELNLSNSRRHSWVQLGYTVDIRAQVEPTSERV